MTRFLVESEYELYMLAGLAQRHAPDGRVAVLPRFDLPVADHLLTDGGRGRRTSGLDPAQADTIVGLLTDGSYPNLELRGVYARLANGLHAPEHLAVAESVVGLDGGTRRTPRPAPHRGERRGRRGAVDYEHPERRFDWQSYGEGLARLVAAHPELTLVSSPVAR